MFANYLVHKMHHLLGGVACQTRVRGDPELAFCAKFSFYRVKVFFPKSISFLMSKMGTIQGSSGWAKHKLRG